MVAREERLDGTGGAVATWVRQVQIDQPQVRTIALTDASGQASTKLLKFVGRAVDSLSKWLASISPWSAVRWERLLWLKGFWYVILLRSQFRRADTLYIHNRPRYAVWARWLGYRGRILIHMHNDPVEYFRRSNAAKRIADGYVFCSEYARRRGVEDCGLPVARTHVLLNGVEAPAPFELVGMKPHLLFVGRLQPLKGPDIAIETLSLLRDRGVPANLTLIGGTEPGMRSVGTPYRQQLVDRAEELNARYGDTVVELLGPMRHEDTLRQMELHPILLVPSRVEEAFGMVLAEAASRGAVPLAPSRGGMPEVLSIAGYAPVAEGDDPSRLAQAVIEAVGSISDADRRSASGRVVQRLEWKRIRADYAAFWDAFVKGSADG
ncbi:glycosyltransferase family 4 protein [Microbacterium arabinogalactanolyticum]|uniref:glycosyltransferase family 4 protein n=1 Tax=Microbacterium arabinogalactanolyticum TaxID=69365 RepID=UPI00404491D4